MSRVVTGPQILMDGSRGRERGCCWPGWLHQRLHQGSKNPFCSPKWSLVSQTNLDIPTSSRAFPSPAWGHIPDPPATGFREGRRRRSTKRRRRRWEDPVSPWKPLGKDLRETLGIWRWPGPIPRSSGGCRGTNNTEERKPWELSQSGVGWWDEALPQRFGGFKALGAGLGGKVLPRSHRAARGEEGPTSLGSPPDHPLGPAAALMVFGLFLSLNFHFNVHFLFQFHISISF